MKKISKLLILTLLVPTLQGWCFNGLQDIGFGAPAKGIGGAATAFPQDTLAALANPANLAPVGTRIDLYAEYIRGTRTGHVFDNHFAHSYIETNGKIDLSRNKNTFIGEAGGSVGFFENRLAVGLLIAPQAGEVITWNKQNPFTSFKTQDVHVNVIYLSFTPTISGQICNNDTIGKHYLGAGVDLTPAWIKLEGLQGLKITGGLLGATDDPSHVTNKGFDSAFGWAVRIGWLGEIRNWLSLGLSFRTKTYMSRFDKYRGAITPHGRADLPAQLFGGIALKPFSKTTIAFDVGEIFYGDVNTFANPVFSLKRKNAHGASNGAGLWWKSITVYKAGICQDIGNAITLRAGYNYGQLPWRENKENVVTGAWFVPSTIRHHMTFGASFSPKWAIFSAAFVYGFKHRIQGPISPQLGSGKATATTDLYQLEIGISKVW